MKTLFILRHGKAEERNPAGDRKRNLAERGQKDALRIGREIRERNAVPELIISSDAARALQTAELCAEGAGYDGRISVEPVIYDGGLSGVMKLLRRCPDETAGVMVVGHNPTLEDIAAQLGDPLGSNAQELDLPTAGLVCFELEIDRWADLRPGSGRLLWRITPKSLQNETS